MPKLSIITINLNNKEGLQKIMASVLSQTFSDFEYIIVDGGSTDNSVEIIKKYEDKLAYWVSEPDKGQSNAINKGFDVATGDILAWLNSDNLYLPGVLNRISTLINTNDVGIYYDDCIHIKYQNQILSSHGSQVIIESMTKDLTICDYIIQPSSFWTRKTWEKVGLLNEEQHFGFDWEWYLRAKFKSIPFNTIEQPILIYRIHATHKTGVGGSKSQKEISQLYSIYNPRIKLLYDLLC